LVLKNPELLPECQKLNGNIFFELFFGDLDENMTSTGYTGERNKNRRDSAIAILTVTSAIVVNVITRGLLAVETEVLLFCGWQNLNIKRLVCKQ